MTAPVSTTKATQFIQDLKNVESSITANKGSLRGKIVAALNKILKDLHIGKRINTFSDKSLVKWASQINQAVVSRLPSADPIKLSAEEATELKTVFLMLTDEIKNNKQRAKFSDHRERIMNLASQHFEKDEASKPQDRSRAGSSTAPTEEQPLVPAGGIPEAPPQPGAGRKNWRGQQSTTPPTGQQPTTTPTGQQPTTTPTKPPPEDDEPVPPRKEVTGGLLSEIHNANKGKLKPATDRKLKPPLAKTDIPPLPLKTLPDGTKPPKPARTPGGRKTWADVETPPPVK